MNFRSHHKLFYEYFPVRGKFAFKLTFAQPNYLLNQTKLKLQYFTHESKKKCAYIHFWRENGMVNEINAFSLRLR